MQKLKLSIGAPNTIRLYYKGTVHIPKKLFMSGLRVKSIKIIHVVVSKKDGLVG